MMSIVLKIKVSSTERLLRGIDHYWSVIMDFAMRDAAFTITDIRSFSSGRRDTIRDFVNRLEKAGFVERVSGEENGIAFRVVVRQSATPKVRRDGTVIAAATRQQAMWNAMRSPVCRQGFTARDLIAFAATDETTISLETAKSYIRFLSAAGYLAQIAPGGPNRLAVWRLLPDMNTGPRPPMVLRSKLIFDQNSNRIIGDVLAGEGRP